MDIKLSREGLTKTGVILLLLSGLVFHDFFILPGVKLGPITITYLRVILVVCIPLLLFFYKVKIRKNDVIAIILLIFMAYGLTRIEGNLKEAFALYCPLVAFFFLYFSIDEKRILENCIDFIAGLLIFFCFVGLFELITGRHFVSTRYDVVNILKHVACGMYYNENDFSAFLSVLILFMLMSHFRKIIKLVFVFFAFVIICLNQSIICILALSAFAIIAFIVWNRNNKFFRFIAVISIVLILLKPIIDLINSSSMWWRSYMYSFGLKNVISHMLIGNGIGKYTEGMIEQGFDVSYSGASADPHNLFFELAGTFGVIWSVLLIILLVKLFTWNLKRAANRQYLYFFGLVLIIPFVGLASSSCMEKNYIYLALLIPMIQYRIYINRLNTNCGISLEKDISFLSDICSV